MRDHLVIFVNGRRHELPRSLAFEPLTDWLRYELRLTGTKVVCAEGDCGSCTVLVGRVRAGRMEYATVCGCIQYLFQLDGAHVVTIEGLKYEGRLNPVQEAFVACHGAQCGFCTPGFVVQLHALLEGGASDEPAIRRGLTGNLCRCTGYEPILRAASQTDVSQMRRLEQLFPMPPQLLAEMQRLATEPVLITHGPHVFCRPDSLAAAAAARRQWEPLQVYAGGTDLGVMFNKKRPEAIRVLSTAGLPGLDSWELADSRLSVGANVRLSELQSVLRGAIPELAEYLEYFGSPQIRNAGTLAGNLATASPIGDMIPPLFVLQAQVVLAGPDRRRCLDINDFYTGYRRTGMQPDELIERVIIPLPRPDEILRLYKVSRRKDLDISTFSAAVWLRLRQGVIVDIRLAFGGVGPVVIRLRKTEAALRGRRLSGETLQAVQPIVRGEISPISDVRGSAEYRNLLAANILRKMHAELAASATSSNGQD
ncbi:MAG: FAD binding domain-containing protein [Phycisphaerales bacterium]|nr:FAD binding domain-containing protein [Phycisphaerales bacterium]